VVRQGTVQRVMTDSRVWGPRVPRLVRSRCVSARRCGVDDRAADACAVESEDQTERVEKVR